MTARHGIRERGSGLRRGAWLLGSLALLVAPAIARSEVVVRVGQVVVIELPRLPQRIGVEDPTIASLTVLPDGHAEVRGERVGRTRIIGRDNAQLPIIIPVRVLPVRGKKKVPGRAQACGTRWPALIASRSLT